MRMILLAGVALTLSACGGTVNEANTAATDNLTVDGNMMMGEGATMNDMGGMDANSALDANTQNLMMQDATTNDPDTNLSNGI
jgi:hypothetical protein